MTNLRRQAVNSGGTPPKRTYPVPNRPTTGAFTSMEFYWLTALIFGVSGQVDAPCQYETADYRQFIAYRLGYRRSHD
jgi:hypothetical protein